MHIIQLHIHAKIHSYRYENTPMQYYIDFLKNLKLQKMKKNHWKIFDIFLIFAQYIHCGYTMEAPRRGGSKEYPQCMFWSKNKKK